MFEGITAIIAAISGVLAKIIPDPDKRLQAEVEIQKALMASQAAIYDAMKGVMAADAASDSWMTKNARPVVVFWCLAMITWVVISPMFGLQQATIAALKAVPDMLWNMTAVLTGGYILGKSITDGMKAKSK